MRIVVDTNCLIASIPRRNPEYWLYEAFHDELFVWLISNEIMAEYEEQLGGFYSIRTADLVLKILSTVPNVEFIEPHFKWRLITTDPDDNKFSDLAISANAEYLVTNDRHFQILKSIPFPTVSVVSLNEFKEIILPETGQKH